MNNDQLAGRIYDRLRGNDGDTELVFVDPVTALAIAKMVMTLISVIQKCKKNSTQVKYTIDKPTVLEAMILKRVIKKHIGIVRYLREGRKFTTAVLQEGRSLTEEEIDGLLSKR